MSKTIQKVLAAVAAAGLAFTPIAAQANTRAGDSGAFYSGSQSQPGQGRTASGESIAGGADILALILVGLWVTGVVLAFADDDDDIFNQSPGAN